MAVLAYSCVRAGERCADTTSISNGIENFASIFADSFMMGRSVSEPIMMPTRGFCLAASPLLKRAPPFLELISDGLQFHPHPKSNRLRSSLCFEFALSSQLLHKRPTVRKGMAGAPAGDPYIPLNIHSGTLDRNSTIRFFRSSSVSLFPLSSTG